MNRPNAVLLLVSLLALPLAKASIPNSKASQNSVAVPAAIAPTAPAASASTTSATATTATTTATTTPTQSTNSFGCNDLQKASQKLPVYVANIVNAKTTRTPEGGPYKRIELKCKEMYCESIPQEDYRVVYEPTNPDANPSGYVRYPRVNTTTEYTALNNAATELKLLASKEICGVKSIMTGSTALVKYDPGSSVQSDTFVFSNDGRLSTWSRTLRDGTMQNFAFNAADGTLITNP